MDQSPLKEGDRVQVNCPEAYCPKLKSNLGVIVKVIEEDSLLSGVFIHMDEEPKGFFIHICRDALAKTVTRVEE